MDKTSYTHYDPYQYISQLVIAVGDSKMQSGCP